MADLVSHLFGKFVFTGEMDARVVEASSGPFSEREIDEIESTGLQHTFLKKSSHEIMKKIDEIRASFGAGVG